MYHPSLLRALLPSSVFVESLQAIPKHITIDSTSQSYPLRIATTFAYPTTSFFEELSLIFDHEQSPKERCDSEPPYGSISLSASCIEPYIPSQQLGVVPRRASLLYRLPSFLDRSWLDITIWHKLT